MNVVACLKWVDLRPEVDPLTGAVHDDERWFGISAADTAALEWALRLGEQWNAEVVAITAGPEGAERILRDALACGAHRAVRVACAGGDSASTAAAIAEAIGNVDVAVCGDYSFDRGSGAVPAFLADYLNAEQALGLLGVDLSGPGVLTVLRRLDGGRRERLRVTSPAVISVEGGLPVRRAPLRALLAAPGYPIETRPGVVSALVTTTSAYRPRPRVLPPPDGDEPLVRIRTLTGAGIERIPPKRMTLEPAAAAAAIVEQLRAWGYLE